MVCLAHDQCVDDTPSPQTPSSLSAAAWFIGGIFVILSFPISVYEVAMHTEHYTQPRLQRHVIRILWMVRHHSLCLMGGGLYMYMAMNCTCMRHC